MATLVVVVVLTYLSPVNWAKRTGSSRINCYSIEEGRVIERPKGRYVSPIRIKHKQQAIANANGGSIGAATPVTRRILQQRTGSDKKDPPADEPTDVTTTTTTTTTVSVSSTSLYKQLSRSIGNIVDTIECRSSPSLGHRSIPYREKKNPLGSTRLSCYQPISLEQGCSGDPAETVGSPANVSALGGYATLHRAPKAPLRHPLYKSVDDLIFLNSVADTDPRTPANPDVLTGGVTQLASSETQDADDRVVEERDEAVEHAVWSCGAFQVEADSAIEANVGTKTTQKKLEFVRHQTAPLQLQRLGSPKQTSTVTDLQQGILTTTTTTKAEGGSHHNHNQSPIATPDTSRTSGGGKAKGPTARRRLSSSSAVSLAVDRDADLLPESTRKAPNRTELPKNDDQLRAMAMDPGDHDETYGFAQMRSTLGPIETAYRLRLEALKQETNAAGGLPMAATFKTPKKKDNFTNKIRAMSDRTQKLFSRIYSTNVSAQKGSGAEGTTAAYLSATKSLKKSSSKLSEASRRSVSYGALPGLADFHTNVATKDYEHIEQPHQLDNRREEREELKQQNTGKHANALDDVDVELVLVTGSTGGANGAGGGGHTDAEDGDSGILVNESGASSILETDDVFHDGLTIPTVPSKVVNGFVDSTEFKLVTIRLDDAPPDASCDGTMEDSAGLGIIVSPIATVDGEVSNRYKVAHVLPGGLVYRLVQVLAPR
uniref:Uncharacterized protein n=1 Tax=Anopheles atroparvus TaxID=41427 RepID=A0A182JKM3_ANOAO